LRSRDDDPRQIDAGRRPFTVISRNVSPGTTVVALLSVAILLAGCGSSTSGRSSAHGKAAAAVERLLTEIRGSGAASSAKGVGGVEVTPVRAQEILRDETAHRGKGAVEEALAELLHRAPGATK
jgi:hypothetical protein